MVDVQAQNSQPDTVTPSSPKRRVGFDTWLNVGIGVIIVAVIALGAYFGWTVYVDRLTNEGTSGSARLVAALTDQVRKNPNDPTLRVRLGEALGAMGKYQPAVEQLNAAIKINTKHYGAYYDLGMIAVLTNHNSDAEVYFKKVLEITEASQYSNVDPTRENALYQLGLLDLSQKRYDEAAGYFKAALVIRKDASDTYLHLAQSLQGLGDSDGAIQQLELGLQFDPNFAQARFLLGQLYQQKNDLVNASYQYAQAAAADPNAQEPKDALKALGSASSWYSKAQTAFSSGNIEGALTAILIARNLDAKNFDYAKLHGDILMKRGDLKNALDVYTQALALQPTNAQMKATVAQLQSQVKTSTPKPKAKVSTKAKAKTAAKTTAKTATVKKQATTTP